MSQKSNSWLKYGLACAGVAMLAFFCYFKPAIIFFSQGYMANIKQVDNGGFLIYFAPTLNIELIE